MDKPHLISKRLKNSTQPGISLKDLIPPSSTNFGETDIFQEIWDQPFLSGAKA